MRIILIGMMGSGKSTIGKKLASEIGANFLDMDDLIEKREGKAITQIFEKNGESYFRALEHLMAKELMCYDDAVISTGGGVVINPHTMEALKGSGVVVYLYLPVARIVERLKGDTTRPLLQNTSLDKRLTEVYNERRSLYETYADVILSIEDKSVETLVRELIEKCKLL